ncbi:hypothetical protein H072_7770 [Dactylellina haptotyla CBS 200.50]|uniref:LysM domain-containing protein n=1 Tax=Dactylellina haptotyla (strain CBS 200.50) TaxID=1284197 RepID=S8BTB5_DACHA|nr:hypothetical protein H072_7770 [Dactylellina haptotyla CBS 200.50]
MSNSLNISQTTTTFSESMVYTASSVLSLSSSYPTERRLPSGEYVVHKCTGLTKYNGEFSVDTLNSCIRLSGLKYAQVKNFCSMSCALKTPVYDIYNFSYEDSVTYQRLLEVCKDPKTLGLALAGECGCFDNILSDICEIPHNSIVQTATTSSSGYSSPSATPSSSTPPSVAECPRDYVGKNKWPMGNCLESVFDSEEGWTAAGVICGAQCDLDPAVDKAWPQVFEALYVKAKKVCHSIDDFNYAFAQGCGCLNYGWVRDCTPRCQPPEGYTTMASTATTSVMSNMWSTTMSPSTSSTMSSAMYSYEHGYSTELVVTTASSATQSPESTTSGEFMGPYISWTTSIYTSKYCDEYGGCYETTITTKVPCSSETTTSSEMSTPAIYTSSSSSSSYSSSAMMTKPTTMSYPSYETNYESSMMETSSTEMSSSIATTMMSTSTSMSTTVMSTPETSWTVTVYTTKSCEECTPTTITTSVPCPPSTSTSMSSMSLTTEMSTSQMSTSNPQTSWTTTVYTTKKCEYCQPMVITTIVPCPPEVHSSSRSSMQTSTVEMPTSTTPMTSMSMSTTEAPTTQPYWTTQVYVTKSCDTCHPTTITITVPCPQTKATSIVTETCRNADCWATTILTTVIITPIPPPITMATVTYATSNAATCTCGNQIPQCTAPPGPPQEGGCAKRCNQWYLVKPTDTCDSIAETLDYQVMKTDILEWNPGCQLGCNITPGRWLCVGTLMPKRVAYATGKPSYGLRPEEYPNQPVVSTPATMVTPYPIETPQETPYPTPAGVYISTETPKQQTAVVTSFVTVGEPTQFTASAIDGAYKN